jgi:two-component system copper resistance phosphate regulon response regulator CusR
VHVNSLRRALEAQGPRLIHTVRGRGYLLGDSHPQAPQESP